MKNIKQHQGKIIDIARLPSSINGNPRFSVLLQVNDPENPLVHFSTAVDSSFGYSIQNFLGGVVVVEVGEHYGRATLASIKLLREYFGRQS